MQLFADVYRWLAPGALFVVSVIAAPDREAMVETGLTFKGGSTAQELDSFICQASYEELVRVAPTYGTLPSITHLKVEHLYFFTTEELAALARITGFQVEKLGYFSPRKYIVLFTLRDEVAILVARKPFS